MNGFNNLEYVVNAALEKTAAFKGTDIPGLNGLKFSGSLKDLRKMFPKQGKPAMTSTPSAVKTEVVQPLQREKTLTDLYNEMPSWLSNAIKNE